MKLLSDNGGEFTSRVFLAVFKILSVESFFTTAYHPQTNGQVERFNRTLVSTLRHYLADIQRDWDQSTDVLTYVYNCTVNRIIGIRPFDLALSRTPSPLALQQTPLLNPSACRAKFKIRCLAWLRCLMSTASRHLLSGQDRCKRDFDNRHRYPTAEYQVGDLVLVNRGAAFRSEEISEKNRVNNKLAPKTEEPFTVVQVDEHTVTILRGTGLKDRLSRDRVIKSPPLRRKVEELPHQATSIGEDEKNPESVPREATSSTRAPGRSSTPGLMDAITDGETGDVLARLAGFRSQVGRKQEPAPEELADSHPVTGSRTATGGPMGPEQPVVRAAPPGTNKRRPPSPGIHLVRRGTLGCQVHVSPLDFPRATPFKSI